MNDEPNAERSRMHDAAPEPPFHRSSFHLHPLARIIARINAARKQGQISAAQQARLIAAAIGEFRA